MLDILDRLIVLYIDKVFSGYDIHYQIRVTNNILSNLLLILLSGAFFTLLNSPSLVMNQAVRDLVDLAFSYRLLIETTYVHNHRNHISHT